MLKYALKKLVTLLNKYYNVKLMQKMFYPDSILCFKNSYYFDIYYMMKIGMEYRRPRP